MKIGGAPSTTAIRTANGKAVVIGILLLIVLPFIVFGNQISEFSGTIARAGYSGTSIAVFGVLALALDPLAPIPSSIVATLMGTRLGLYFGSIVNLLGMGLGCVLGYFIGSGGRAVMALRHWKISDQFEAWVNRYGLIAVLLTRPVPVLSEATLIIAGIGRAKLKPLLLWTLIAQSGLAISYAVIGHVGAQAETYNTVILLIGHIGIPVFAALIVAIWMFKESRKQGHEYVD